MNLVVLAGGIGSRFGGAKQIEPVDDYGNFIMDYSIFDAKKSGFDKVVLIIKSEYLSYVKDTLGKRLENKIEVEYVLQTTDLSKFGINILRKKPLGTAHAILCAKNAVNDNFCVVNADDFYGAKSFVIASNFLKNTDKNSSDFGLVGYKLGNTLSNFGEVKRGICKVKNGYVMSIDECCVEKNNKIVARNILTNKIEKVFSSSKTSMNMFCLTPKFFDYLQKKFDLFLKSNDLSTDEFLLPKVVCEMANENLATIKFLLTNEKWIGMTYKSDKQLVVQRLKTLADKNIYPKDLWSD